MNIYEESLKFHKELKGKLEITSRVKITNEKDLSLAYTPGVAEPCREIHKDPSTAYLYTRKWNTVAVISDGTAVLGLGDIGPLASLPVMEGKSILFKEFADVDAFPIVLDTKEVDEIVDTIVRIAPTLGGINLEDISAPRCFEIEKKLKEKLNIPVFHDDQHGTAIIVLSGLINALKIVNKNIEDLKIVVNGAGSAGTAITKLLLSYGAKNIVICDRDGALNRNTNYSNKYFEELSKITNPNNESGILKDVIKNADVFIGVSAPNIVSKEMVSSMNDDSIIFAMANPTPEIFPDAAREAGAKVIGTGRSDFPNQINNVLAFPGIFRGALDVRATEINEEMKIAAAYAIANSVSKEELNPNYIIPKAFNLDVQKRVSEAVKEAAIKSGVATI
ncbi:NADP-dependent malic enzyme [uncultured Clostridium sp.]|uniref:NAD(P)-dependent malic enzyme n=1 Tax=uncultured Clostridium sp. TaxID=59620 RepID=UPI0025D4B492|nr:malic enzyme-like NAD(P)-binding protein [uncultured Clostridium sp.]MDU4884492.1 malic enzyme-like NAD(P)-binding protein [Clostridium celatum]MDU7077661.1 malic enzyme-like NAD(P)-binding protein [Clostridium celatum]